MDMNLYPAWPPHDFTQCIFDLPAVVRADVIEDERAGHFFGGELYHVRKPRVSVQDHPGPGESERSFLDILYQCLVRVIGSLQCVDLLDVSF